jgi:putative transposase
MNGSFVLDVLNSPRLVNCAAAAIHAQLLDEGRYLASVRTMYRLLQSCAAVRKRRNQLRHREYTKPELLAVMPNQVWELEHHETEGAGQAPCFHLYVILDIFSRSDGPNRKPQNWPSGSSPTARR